MISRNFVYTSVICAFIGYSFGVEYMETKGNFKSSWIVASSNKYKTASESEVFDLKKKLYFIRQFYISITKL